VGLQVITDTLGEFKNGREAASHEATEGYGFSNDVKGSLGAPSFAAASFAYEGRSLELTISLQY
jgi:uncharacterized protein (DUF2141 family)